MYVVLILCYVYSVFIPGDLEKFHHIEKCFEQSYKKKHSSNSKVQLEEFRVYGLGFRV